MSEIERIARMAAVVLEEPSQNDIYVTLKYRRYADLPDRWWAVAGKHDGYGATAEDAIVDVGAKLSSELGLRIERAQKKIDAAREAMVVRPGPRCRLCGNERHGCICAVAGKSFDPEPAPNESEGNDG